MATPDDVGAGATHRGRERRRLRIVQYHDVPRLHHRREFVGAASCRFLIVAALDAAEWPAVAGRAVQVIVDPLRDLEEATVTVDHDPAGVDTHAPCIREQHLQQLGNTTAGRGRIQVEDGSAIEERKCVQGRRGEGGSSLRPDERLQQLRREPPAPPPARVSWVPTLGVRCSQWRTRRDQAWPREEEWRCLLSRP
jgi:hypothetical protein